MIKNYLKATIRYIKNQFLYSFINILGLTLGITCAIYIFAWIYDETSFDNFHPKVDQFYRVESLMPFEKPTLWSSTPGPLCESIKKDFAEVENSVIMKTSYMPIIKYGENTITEDGFYFVSEDFFKLFGVKTLFDKPINKIKEPLTVLISSSIAKKYFGDEDPVDKTIELNQSKTYTVKGVFEDYPNNSHLKINFITSFENYGVNKEYFARWGTYNYYTYVSFRQDADIELVKTKLKTYIQNYTPGSKVEFQLQKVRDIHLHSKYGKGDITYVYVFTAIGLLLLIIAFINFVNISTAKALERTKEIAIRKTHGATRKILMKQIFFELSILTSISILLSALIAIFLIPSFNQIASKEFTIQGLFQLRLVLTILGLIIFAIITSGFYPAVYLSSFNPCAIIGKGSSKTKGNSLRKILVGLQYTISVALILGAFIIQNQLSYIRSKNLGFDKDQLMYINLNYRADDKYSTVGEELVKVAGIDTIAYSQQLPVNLGRFSHISRWDGNTEEDDDVMINQILVNHNFIPVYKIKLAQGRNFRESDNHLKVILNQQAADRMGLETAVGKNIYEDGDVYEIIGVAENFHFKPLSKKIDPLMLMHAPQNRVLTFRLKSKDIVSSIKEIKSTVENIIPEYPFSYGFVDEDIDKLYRSEIRIGKLVSIFTIIAIFTSCLGIFGLSAFMAQSRTKEIGIRKTLGSTTHKIVILMSKDLIFISVIANILGGLVGYYFLNKWLDNFAYKINISTGVFILVFVISILIALITISFHAIKSAKSNPADTLRYE